MKIDDNTVNEPVLVNGDEYGSSVVSLGDLDGDAVSDIAVGASGDATGGDIVVVDSPVLNSLRIADLRCGSAQKRYMSFMTRHNTMEISTRNPSFILRQASSTDVPLILSFIRELAEYEKLAHEVVASEEVLRESLFGERKVAEVILGFYEHEPVSFVVFSHNFSTFLGRPGIYLEDLYVKPKMRGQGLGKIMLAYLANLAQERDCGRLEWWVLDWNESALEFYRSIGAESMDEWTVQRVTGDALKKLAAQY